MTDAMTTGPAPYPVPALRVTATYPASDGRVPEDMAVEFGGDGPVDPELVDRAVRALADVAARRDYLLTQMPREYLIRTTERAAAATTCEAAHEAAATQAAVASTKGAAGAPLVDREALAADLARREKVGVSA